MQERRNGRQLTLIGIGLIVLVLAVSYFVSHRGGGTSTASRVPQAAVAASTILMASQTIPQGTVFKSGQQLNQYFEVREVPPSLVPFSAYTSLGQISQLMQSRGCGPVQADGCQGQITTTQTIYQNTPVVSGMFTSLGQYRQGPGPSFAIPFGFVGIAVNMDAANSVLGSIQAGDDIDLIASYKGGVLKKSRTEGQTQFALTDMRVISVNAPPSIGNGANAAPTSTGSSANPSQAQVQAATTTGSIVLLARYQQALIIQHLKDFGWQLSAVLRSSKETDILHFKTLPVTDKWFFSKNPNPFQSNPGY